jgi:membrane protein
VDRSLALGAQALLALIPLLIALGAFLPSRWSRELTGQVGEALGVAESALDSLRAALSVGQPQGGTSAIGVLVALLSASSFARALQRMLARVWEVPRQHGVWAIGSSVVWIVGWVTLLQIAALLVGTLRGVPLDDFVRITAEVAFNAVLWWWSMWFLLGRQVPWSRLAPSALLTGVLIVAFHQVGSVVMPRWTSASLEQYGVLGAVFSLGTWLVVFGGVIIVGAVLGRLISDWLAARPSRSPSL